MKFSRIFPPCRVSQISVLSSVFFLEEQRTYVQNFYIIGRIISLSYANKFGVNLLAISVEGIFYIS
jgi:hypothetical protein